MVGIDILSITCFLANFLHSSILLNSFLLKDNDGNLFAFSDAAHGPYKPMTLGCWTSKFLSVIFVFEESQIRDIKSRSIQPLATRQTQACERDLFYKLAAFVFHFEIILRGRLLSQFIAQLI